MFAKQTWEATLSKELRLFDTNVEVICNFECVRFMQRIISADMRFGNKSRRLTLTYV
jgi:hypothetical protein